MNKVLPIIWPSINSGWNYFALKESWGLEASNVYLFYIILYQAFWTKLVFLQLHQSQEELSKELFTWSLHEDWSKWYKSRIHKKSQSRYSTDSGSSCWRRNFVYFRHYQDLYFIIYQKENFVNIIHNNRITVVWKKKSYLLIHATKEIIWRSS